MIPAAFSFARAESLADAIELLATHGEEAKLLAGGQPLLPLMKLRLAAPSMLIDIDAVPDLGTTREERDAVAVGALARLGDVARDPVLARHTPLLSHAAGLVGDPQVRHRATIGGAIAHADPAGDPSIVLLALDGEVVGRGPGGERTVRVSDLFSGPFETELRPDEVLTQIRFPKLLLGTGWSYVKFRRRAIVGVAALLERQDDVDREARVALSNRRSLPASPGGGGRPPRRSGDVRDVRPSRRARSRGGPALRPMGTAARLVARGGEGRRSPCARGSPRTVYGRRQRRLNAAAPKGWNSPAWCLTVALASRKESSMLGIFQSLGAPGLILVLVVLLPLFGDRRLPDLARSIGTSSREFKRGLKEPEPQQPGVTAPPAGTRDA